MAGYFNDNSLSIGRTPLVRLNRITDGAEATVLAKIEGRNPAYSVKCRIGAAHDLGRRTARPARPRQGDRRADQRQHRHRAGLRRRGARHSDHADDARDDEPRAAQAAASLRRQAGADRGRKGHEGRHRQGRGDRCIRPERYVLPQQFKNPANPAIHEPTTGPEIWDDTDGEIDVLVAGVGTGGTITGVSRFIKNTKGKQIVSVAVEPADSPVLTQTRAGEALKPGPHKIQGIGAGFVPDVLDLSLVDAVEQVTQRGGHRLRAPPGARGGDPLRHLLRRGHRGRALRWRAQARDARARPSS